MSVLGWEDKNYACIRQKCLMDWHGRLSILFIPNESQSLWSNALAQCSSVWRKRRGKSLKSILGRRSISLKAVLPSGICP